MKLYFLASRNRGRGIELAMVLLIDRVVALFSLMALTIGLALLDGRLMREHSIIQWLVTGSAAAIGGGMVLAAATCSTTIRASRAFNNVISRLPFHHFLERASNTLYAFRSHKRVLMLAAPLSACLVIWRRQACSDMWARSSSPRLRG